MIEFNRAIPYVFVQKKFNACSTLNTIYNVYYTKLIHIITKNQIRKWENGRESSKRPRGDMKSISYNNIGMYCVERNICLLKEHILDAK